jgi:hypothetical protein
LARFNATRHFLGANPQGRQFVVTLRLRRDRLHGVDSVPVREAHHRELLLALIEFAGVLGEPRRQVR